MTIRTLALSAGVLGIVLSTPAVTLAEKPQEESVSAAPPIYQLPKVGKPTGRVGGGRRGVGDLPAIYALVPDHIGYSASAQPVLYWYLSEPTAGQARFELTLIDEESPRPIVDRRIAAPAQSGLQSIRLSELGVKLKPGEEYQWSVSLVPDAGDRSKDVVSSGWIEVVEAPADLAARLDTAGPDGAAAVYGESGLWYDTLEAAMAQVRRSPGDDAARAQLAGLLEGVGLPEEAAQP